VPGEVCRDLARASALEWLETNGRGGYAMGTVSGLASRRYHGHLVAALRPPVDRHVLLSKLHEALVVDGDEHPLFTVRYPGTVQPEGFRALQEFRLDPFPIWTFSAGGVTFTKALFLVHGEDTVVVRYRASGACTLRIGVFLAFRDHHALTHENGALDGAVRALGRTVRLRPYPSLPELRLHHGGARVDPRGDWYRRVEYAGEEERGLDFREDLWRACTLELDLPPGGETFVAATLGERRIDAAAVDALERQERARRADARPHPLPAAPPDVPAARRHPLPAAPRDVPGARPHPLPAAPPDVPAARRHPLPAATPRGEGRGEGDPLELLTTRLLAAADGYLARRADGQPTVIAGYPWFSDWGRDTMIALPGLLVARGLLDQAKDVVRGFLRHLDQGLLPNRFPDGGEAPEYNTADATLWLFQAVHAIAAAAPGGDAAFLAEVLPALGEILAWHERGTHHGIRVDPADGLLVAGGPGTQLTWMDAKVGDWVVTPRHGKPVEVNALWVNALRLGARWAVALGRTGDAAGWTAAADRAQGSFDAAFWDEARGHLVDVVRPEGRDARLRPNQLLAVSLPFPLLDPPRRRAVVLAVERALLTPVGPRTLAPGEPDYQPRYRGGPRERDGAYHQGVVWPWLLGPFVRARLSAFGRTPENLARCRALVAGLAAHLEDACLGQVSELLEAEPPHRPAGAPAQAWSVAAMLELLLVDLAEPGPAAPR
jgi:glycogen debranching enzyme